jgi:hypothetical protein
MEIKMEAESSGNGDGCDEDTVESKPIYKKQKSSPCPPPPPPPPSSSSSSCSPSSEVKSLVNSPPHPDARFVGAPIKKEDASSRWPDKYTNKKKPKVCFVENTT